MSSVFRAAHEPTSSACANALDADASSASTTSAERRSVTIVAEHGVGSHLEPSASFLKCELTMKWLRQIPRIVDHGGDDEHLAAAEMATTSKYSVTVAFSLYGTPFFRRYPARMFVVTTVSDPPAGQEHRVRLPRSHCAVESPCHVGVPAARCGGPEPEEPRLRAGVHVDPQCVVVLPGDVNAEPAAA